MTRLGLWLRRRVRAWLFYDGSALSFTDRSYCEVSAELLHKQGYTRHAAAIRAALAIIPEASE